MIPFFVMLVAMAAARAAGAFGAEALDSWRDASRIGLAAMFFLTGAAHFNRRRPFSSPFRGSRSWRARPGFWCRPPLARRRRGWRSCWIAA